MTTKILIVDDHGIVADAIKTRIEDGFSNRGSSIDIRSCSTIKAAVTILLEEQFDLVLMDLGLPDLPPEPRPTGLGIYMVRTLVHTPIVVISGADDDATIQQCQAAGARGFLSKALAAPSLMDAVDAALEPGEFFGISPTADSLKRRSRDAANERETETGLVNEFGLTPRQMGVLALMVDGRSNKEIADRFGLAEGTVKIHVRGVLEKLGIERRLQAKEALKARGITLPGLEDEAA